MLDILACQGTGHIARNCPNAAADGAASSPAADGAVPAANGGGKACYTCGKTGQSNIITLAREGKEIQRRTSTERCPFLQDTCPPTASRTLLEPLRLLVLVESLTAKASSASEFASSRSVMVVIILRLRFSNCGMPNHSAANCLAPPKAAATKACYTCGGGMYSIYYDKQGQICKQTNTNTSPFTLADHFARDCPSGSGGRAERPPRACYNCGALGVSFRFAYTLEIPPANRQISLIQHIASACTSEPLAPAA